MPGAKEDMDVKSAIEFIAKANNKTVEEIKADMQEAIDSAKDTEGFKKAFGDHMPTVEEFILKAGDMVKELKQKNGN